MTDSNFIQQFEEKIQQFNKLRESIGSTINMKRKFTQDLKDRLKGIGDRIQVLYGLIGDLKNNKDNFERQLNDNKTNMQNNTNEMNANNGKIAALEKEKAEMQQEISNKINEKQTEVEKKKKLQSELQALQQQIAQLQTENQRLQTENQRLQTENQILQEKVQAATQAIQTAIEDLTNLMNEVPNANTQQEIEPILNSIMESIEGSIRMINDNNNTQGPAPEQAATGIQTSNVPPRLPIQELTKDTIPLVLDNLQQRINILPDGQEKEMTKNALNNINSQKNQGITDEKVKQFYNQAFQKGGKRTRKMRNKMRKRKTKTRKIKKSKKHQKGGFIYNPNSKRKQLKSSKNATRSKSSTRKRTYSSRTSRQSSKSV
jgi:predicted nuclease with TOPRIM domain